jgi:calcium-dependent protein kinase
MLGKKYDYVKSIGQGGNATVSLVKSRIIPTEYYACKAIPKLLDPSHHSERKIQTHSENVKKEVSIMKLLKNDDHIVQIEDVFEDDSNWYIVMESCPGGNITNYLEKNQNKLSEECVRDIIKQCLKIIAICHNQDIIHNDIKPENFLFKTENNVESIKLIDFGISIDARNKNDNPMLEMTPWYGSPETLSSNTCKKSDVWSIGVMTHLLLTGKFPFNDKNNPFRPSVYKIWNSVLNDSVDFSKSYWNDITNDAKDFVSKLLVKDPNDRPTVYEALSHPWITKRDFDIRYDIGRQVVENITKYNKHNIIIRTIFEEFVDILLERFDRDNDSYEKLQRNPSDNSLYNSDKAIISLNNSRLSYILHVLKEKKITKNDKITKQDFKSVLKRLNSKQQLDDIVDELKNDESTSNDDINIRTIISSQLNWEQLISDRQAFEAFLTDVFNELDKDKRGFVRKMDTKKGPCHIIFSSKSLLTFEEFMEKINNVVDDFTE